MIPFFIRLPGEAQKIERIMDAFSAQFYANNPWSFRHADTAFKLAYSVIFFIFFSTRSTSTGQIFFLPVTFCRSCMLTLPSNLRTR